MKTHGVQQVIVECHELAFMESVMHDRNDTTDTLLDPGIGNFIPSGGGTRRAVP